MASSFVSPGLRGIRDLAEALGHDPDAIPIRSITVRAEAGGPVTAAIEQLVPSEQLGRIAEIVRRSAPGRKTRAGDDFERFVPEVPGSE